jgi:hypothetical protein
MQPKLNSPPSVRTFRSVVVFWRPFHCCIRGSEMYSKHSFSLIYLELCDFAENIYYTQVSSFFIAFVRNLVVSGGN